MGMSRCWEWGGPFYNTGYGRRGQVLAHRVAYQEEVGPISEGMECHHICGNRKCVNTDHIRLVTRKEHHAVDPAHQANARRAGDQQLAKTHCPSGHPYSGDNLYIDAVGARVCRMCKRDWMRRKRATISLSPGVEPWR